MSRGNPTADRYRVVGLSCSCLSRSIYSCWRLSCSVVIWGKRLSHYTASPSEAPCSNLSYRKSSRCRLSRHVIPWGLSRQAI